MLKPAGIYIHLPFCERKCTYCNFNTTDFVETLAADYVETVAVELANWGERVANSTGKKGVVDSIYLGGGTPSILEAEQVRCLIEASHAAFDVQQDSEITIEINPATFSRTKLERWREAGINRASVGVQSFLDRELISLSRTHTAAQARRTIEILREAGFDNLSLDLIAGLPEQTISDWVFNLREALILHPEHLSLYLLEVKESTQLLAQIKRGIRPQPDDDINAEMYRLISEMTEASGYDHYEISNFALSDNPSRRAQHNLKYWTDASYYGVGCGAHSYDQRARWMNTLRTESYIEAIQTSGFAIAEQVELSTEDRFVEALFMGLRLKEGIVLEEFRRKYEIDVMERFGESLARLGEAGLIEITPSNLRLTFKGRLLSNEVFVLFV